MKTTAILYISLLLLGTNSQFLRFLQSSKNSYDYSSYSATSTNENLSGKSLSSKTADQSVVYVTKSGIAISDSNLNKESGDSSKTESSEFYGINSAVLVNGGELTMTGGSITTSAKGANAVVATNNGKVKITGTKIISTGPRSSRGLHSTFGGKIEATKVNISTQGGSCASLATDRGEGTITCTECILSTGGAGSPLIYSTGDITISKTIGTATGAQAVVIEGKNTATIKESSNLKCTGMPNRKTVDQCGVMLYQSMSGDAASGTSTFNCDKSSIEIQSSSSVYSSAPMFFITNTQAKINLEECTLKYGSGIFLKAEGTSEWGNIGSNGGIVTLTLTNQDIEGDIIVDTYSGLTINLIGSTITGKINEANTAAKISIILDEDSSIILTGNSFYTSLINEKTDGSNLINGTYKWTASSEKEITSSSNQRNGNNNNQSPDGENPNGQKGEPDSQTPNNMPNGIPPENPNGNQNGQPPNDFSGTPNGQPPNGSDLPNGAPNGQPPNGSNGIPNGQPPSGSGLPNGDPNGQPPNGSNGMPNGQPPNGSDLPNGAPNGQPPNGSNGIPNGQPPNGSDLPNGQPPNGSNGMPNGQPPNGSDLPNGQPPNDFQNGVPDGNSNDFSNNEEDIDPENIGKYIKNSSLKLNNYAYLTLMIVFVIIS